MRLRILVTLLTATAAAGCGSDGGDGGGGAADKEGKCFARMDGATVDIIDITNTASNAWMDGSTLNIDCSVSDEGYFETLLSFKLKAFDGPRIYTLDATDKFGVVSYHGNDGNNYENIDQDRQSTCSIEVAERTDTSLQGTFSCTDLGTYINDPQGACCDNVYVNVTNGSFDLPF